jgi:hypothetical protein
MTDTLAKRLATILAEVASLPQTELEAVTSEAIAEAYQEIGCGLREDLALCVLLMGEQVTDNGHADQADLARFYDEESTFKDSDHKPSDCRKWSRSHGKACEAFGSANLALLKARTNLSKRLAKADL